MDRPWLAQARAAAHSPSACGRRTATAITRADDPYEAMREAVLAMVQTSPPLTPSQRRDIAGILAVTPGAGETA